MNAEGIEKRIWDSGLGQTDVRRIAEGVRALAGIPDPAQRWLRISGNVLEPTHPFSVHQALFRWNYADWDTARGPAPAWLPTEDEVRASNLGRLMAELGISDYPSLHAWSVRERGEFWGRMLGLLGIRFDRPFGAILDPQSRPEAQRWLPGARLNIAASCFSAPRESAAIVFQTGDRLGRVTVGQLERLVHQVAHGLVRRGLAPGDRVALALPMSVESVAAYLGVVAAGCVAVSIPVSLAPAEIASRLRIAPARAMITQDHLRRAGKLLPMYEKAVTADAPPTIVIPGAEGLSLSMRHQDVLWTNFLGEELPFLPVPRAAHDHLNILFSSGTSGEPKAIPWTQTTPVKSASDGYLHQDLRPGDVLAWPTNLGWMMGPWLIFAGLINRCTLALYDEVPTEADFCRFVERAAVTKLGLVPSLIKAWRAGGCTDGVDWRGVKLFSSTGECSNEEDMFWLMGRAGYRPVIEYCGGTELGGGYVAGTVVQPSAPAAFSTPTMGSDFTIRTAHGAECDNGEVYLIPPTMGFSTELLNADHDRVYFAGAPSGSGGVPLRRHGDQLERLPVGYYRAHGRCDDTMNLGGIKVSSVELERAVAMLDWVNAAAAIAVSPPEGGPSELVICVVPESASALDPEEMRRAMQKAIRETLNPLFKIKEVIPMDSLPQTASNKVMRRRLRELYMARDGEGAPGPARRHRT